NEKSRSDFLHRRVYTWRLLLPMILWRRVLTHPAGVRLRRKCLALEIFNETISSQLLDGQQPRGRSERTLMSPIGVFMSTGFGARAGRAPALLDLDPGRGDDRLPLAGVLPDQLGKARCARLARAGTLAGEAVEIGGIALGGVHRALQPRDDRRRGC